MGDGVHMSGLLSWGQHGTILVLHHGVDDRLGVDHHLDLFGRRVEQPARLYVFQPLLIMVAESTEIWPHGPVGMGHRLNR